MADRQTDRDTGGLAPSDYVIKITGGAMSGTKIPVRKQEFSLGRAFEADVHINDTLISRVHCKLALGPEGWLLEDLNSTNGTWIVGQKVDGRIRLPLKTPVRIGRTIFEVYDLYGGDKTSVVHAQQAQKQPTISLRIQPETLVSSLHAGEKVVVEPREESKRLAAVYKFQNLISSVFDEKELLAKILNSICNVVPADKAFLLLFDIKSGDFNPAIGRTGDKILKGKEIPAADVNTTLVEFVKDNRESVLSIDPYKDGRLTETKVPNLNEIMTSTMCVPMLGKQQINGMIFMSLTSPTERYSEDDLRLLTVLGHTSGMALEHSKMMAFNIKNERLVATGTTAATLSHYIKNILAGLDGSLNLLRMGLDEKNYELSDEAWHILNKNHRRLGNVVLDLLNLASEQKPNFSIENINAIIMDVAELIEPQFRQEGISLELNPQTKDLPLYAEVDAKGIHRILLNLLNNAEFAIQLRQTTLNQKDIGAVKIWANFNDNKDYVVINVEDNGVGLEQEETKKIFDLFITSKGSAGTGLGLAVCKRIVEAHDGSITVSAEKGKGCIFSFSLPVSHNEMNTSTRTLKRIF